MECQLNPRYLQTFKYLKQIAPAANFAHFH